MPWEPITDLPKDWINLVSTEIDSLAEAWSETLRSLKDTPMLEEFNKRLSREWAIETGIIERIYTIDRGTTQMLIEKGIDANFITHGATDRPTGEVIQIINDQCQALDGLFLFVNQKQSLTLHYIRTLHQILLRHQDYTEALDQFGNIGQVALIRGDWKRQPNNPRRPDGIVHEYCPPEQVQSEMERLIMLHNQHIEQQVSSQVEAAWIHHRFTQIHPFQDGNGRVARSLATLVLLRAGRFPLVINRDHWVEYISALEEADVGDLSRLVRLFDQIEKRAYIQALELSEDVLKTREPIFHLVDSIAERYQERQQHLYDRVFTIAQQLSEKARAIMEERAEYIRKQFQQRGLPISVRVDTSSSETSHWNKVQIVETARKLGYFANLTRPRLWVRLRLLDEKGIAHANAEIVLSLHYLGKENRGVMIATAFLDIVHSPDHEDVEKPPIDRGFRETHTIVTDGFTFAHTDAALSEQRQKEFHEWLDQAIIVGLAEWQKQL